jgi:methyl-accepting chemotaxis protein
VQEPVSPPGAARTLPGDKTVANKGTFIRLTIILVILDAVLAAAGLALARAAGAALGPTLIVWFSFGAALAVVVPLLALSRWILSPLAKLYSVIHAMHSDGDLSRRVPVARHDEVGATVQAYNELIESIQGIVGKVYFNSLQVADAAEQLTQDAGRVAGGSDQQRQAAEATMHAAQEMTTGINLLAESAERTAENAHSARELSEHGAGIVEQASTEIERIAGLVEQSAQTVAALGERSQAISGIVGVIHEIADQTNLLALNAAIEAARAGEQGRGFAVVADEVRKLAERTTQATAEIGGMISAIQGETQSAIAAIQDGSSQAHAGANLARQAAESLQKINHGAQETMEKVEAIAAAIHEQSVNSQSIAGHMQEILTMAQSNSAVASRTLREAAQLDHLAANLKEVGTVFKLGPQGERAIDIHKRMPSVAKQAALDIGRVLETAVTRGEVKLEDLFDHNYTPIAGTKPQKFHSRFDALTDRIFPAVQEPLLDKHSEVAYAGAVDLNGYFPTHNKRYSQPLTGDEKIDIVNNRTKRVFSDPVGKRCGSHEQEFLLQTYRRDTGEIMHDLSVPIYVQGRHWGGFRIGYRA